MREWNDRELSRLETGTRDTLQIMIPSDHASMQSVRPIRTSQKAASQAASRDLRRLGRDLGRLTRDLADEALGLVAEVEPPQRQR